MADLLSFLSRCFSRAPARPAPSALVLLASERLGDFAILEELLRDSRWSLAGASSWTEIAAWCRSAPNLIVLVDDRFQESSWHAAMQTLPNHPALILLSDVADPYLWSEFVRSGGFEIVARPFDREELLGALAFARKHLDARWPQLAVR